MTIEAAEWPRRGSHPCARGGQPGEGDQAPLKATVGPSGGGAVGRSSAGLENRFADCQGGRIAGPQKPGAGAPECPFGVIFWPPRPQFTGPAIRGGVLKTRDREPRSRSLRERVEHGGAVDQVPRWVEHTGGGKVHHVIRDFPCQRGRVSDDEEGREEVLGA